MDLTKIIIDSIAKQSREGTRKYIGASLIGRPCDRSIWYDYNGYKGVDYPVNIKIAFDIGHRLEEMLIMYLRRAGFRIESPTEENQLLFCQDKDVPIFQGHCDGVLWLDGKPYSIIEFKTAKHSGFQRFITKGLNEWSSGYYAQLQSYMGMRGLSRGAIIVLDKDNGSIHHEWVEFDEIYYHGLMKKALHISTANEPPPKINKSPLYFLCGQCKFKNICHV